MSLACPTFRMTWINARRIQDGYTPDYDIPVSDRSLCFKECLEKDCTMFTYQTKFDGSDDLCKLYTMAYDVAKTEFVLWTTLHIRVCTSTGKKPAS